MLDVLALGPEARMVLGFQLMDASTTAAAVALGSSSHIGFCGVHGKPFVEVPLQSGVRGVCWDRRNRCWIAEYKVHGGRFWPDHTWSGQVMTLWSRPVDLPTGSLGNRMVGSNVAWIVRLNAAWMVTRNASFESSPRISASRALASITDSILKRLQDPRQDTNATLGTSCARIT